MDEQEQREQEVLGAIRRISPTHVEIPIPPGVEFASPAWNAWICHVIPLADSMLETSDTREKAQGE